MIRHYQQGIDISRVSLTREGLIHVWKRGPCSQNPLQKHLCYSTSSQFNELMIEHTLFISAPAFFLCSINVWTKILQNSSESCWGPSGTERVIYPALREFILDRHRNREGEGNGRVYVRWKWCTCSDTQGVSCTCKETCSPSRLIFLEYKAPRETNETLLII